MKKNLKIKMQNNSLFFLITTFLSESKFNQSGIRIFWIVFSLILCNYALHAQSLYAVPDSVNQQLAKIKAANKTQAAKIQFQYFVIKADRGTFGYDVYTDGKLYLHQITIPAVGGINGFADTASAGATARLAIQKMKQGELPPTITVDELKN